ncbi:MAG: NAD(+) synthase [Corallococcus sp.]|nr:NAD(+) synthase [Corallococcus sp.]
MGDSSNIIGKIRERKKTLGITNARLAQQSGVSQGTLNKILSGEAKNPRRENIAKLCNALGITAENFASQQNTCQSHCKDMSFGLLKVAADCCEIRVSDCDFNARAIVNKLHSLADSGVKLAVLPELCVTGYTCGDLFFQRNLIDNAEVALSYILQNTCQIDLVFAIGLPVRVDGRLYNCAAVAYKGQLLGIVPKSNLPNYNEFSEKRYFFAAPRNITQITLCGTKVPFGTNLLFKNTLRDEYCFACEVCEDVWVANPPSTAHCRNGANVILNLSASNETVAKAEYRRKMIEMQSARCCCIYAYSSCGEGESTSDVVFSAHNMLAENGKMLAEARLFEMQSAICEADLELITHDRTKSYDQTDPDAEYLTVYFTQTLDNIKNPLRSYPQMPFVPSDKKELHSRAELILTMQAHALKKRMQSARADKLVLGVSGGLDSSLALFACVRALKLAGKPANDLVAVTMPCFGTTERTLNNSISLANAVKATVRKIDISQAVLRHFDDIGHDRNNVDVVYENSQARERTQVLMDIANGINALVVGTGDLSEIALGWSTYNGDQMSMYAVNSSVPKTLIPKIVQYEAQRLGGEIINTVNDIVATPISPELKPAAADGQIDQRTENVIGSYKLHDYFLYLFVRCGYSPAKILYFAQRTFAGEFSVEEIKRTLKVFLRRFFTQQFKRAASPDGIRLGTVGLSARSEWRMPSDVSFEQYLAELE